MTPITLHLCSLFIALLGLEGGAMNPEPERQFHNEWAVGISGGERVARDVAEDYGFTFIKRIGNLEDMYKFEKDDHRKRSKRHAVEITSLLEEDKRVSWVEQQETHFHTKRDVMILPQDATGDDYIPPFNDPMFPKQWYLHNVGQNTAQRGVDMNLAPAWKLGIMGKGVVVTIVDDGVDGTHPDLKTNFDPKASWDFNGNDSNPHPDDRPERGSENNHGTRCAGEVAAEANNGICGVGTAPEASIGGIRFLDGDVTDAIEADALVYNNQHIDIYSCCWGPSDNGKTMREPGKLMKGALEKGAKEGRGGKGSIYVWASGNGGHNGDDCGADGYVGNIQTISVGSVNDRGESVYFMEKCSSTMAVSLSGGISDAKNKRDFNRPRNLVVTTDIHDGCIDNFLGTSSAAPLAAGLFALVLQANPNLTWRDVQHIVVNGAHIPNAEEHGWHINGAGFHINDKFGFGMLDAGKMVELALTWNNVGQQMVCEVPTKNYSESIHQGTSTTVNIEVDCPDISKLEHTVASISYEAPRRGDISLVLWSPSGTPSELISTRKNDNATMAVVSFPFMSVRNWGEDPNGVWRLNVVYHHTPPEVLDNDPKYPDIPRRSSKTAHFTGVGLSFYGTNDLGHTRPTTTNEKNPAVNPDLAGSIKDSGVIDIYNKEQSDDEEIVIDADKLAKGVKKPPNTEHNLDSDDDIDTGEFDGILKDPEVRALIKNIYYARKANEKRRLEERRFQQTKRRKYKEVMKKGLYEERSHAQEVRSQDQMRSNDHNDWRRDAIEEIAQLLKNY